MPEFEHLTEAANDALAGAEPVAPIAPVENLAGLGADAQIDADAFDRAQRQAAFSQAVGPQLSAADFARADENFARIPDGLRPAWDEHYEAADIDEKAFLLRKLSEGFVPSAGPERYADELQIARDKHSAQRELNALLKSATPGTPAYADPDVQTRVRALNELIYGGTPLVGRSMRTV